MNCNHIVFFYFLPGDRLGSHLIWKCFSHSLILFCAMQLNGVMTTDVCGGYNMDDNYYHYCNHRHLHRTQTITRILMSVDTHTHSDAIFFSQKKNTLQLVLFSPFACLLFNNGRFLFFIAPSFDRINRSVIIIMI